ncbi:hypothetical protein [Pseudoalteromonas sp. Of11M-6]|uniref:hypothetical protein n=1 Tax=Pseudoalteromonas sp. Of11M-6 TaxID=2917754 RepID=UPI001EF69D2D|nr:hypothetical protein [Pseudoalteromonas sp. Of11M-6]MCG7554436.1 hypothetical protein [Pseudoalteromonas sp. Of11M-6]
MTIELNMTGLQTLVETTLTPLKDYHGDLLPWRGEMVESHSFALEDITTSVTGESKIELINASTVIDEDGIIGEQKEVNANLESTTTLTYSDEVCWIKYSTHIDFDLTGASKAELLGINTDGQAQCKLAAYLCHQPHEAVGFALGRDLATMPVIFDVEDIKSLAPNNALMMETAGALTVSANFRWSDIIAQNLDMFSRWLDQGELLDINLDSALNADLNIEIRGGFRVVFSKRLDKPHHTFLAIKKSTLSNTALTITGGVNAKFADQAGFKQAYSSILTGIFNAPLDKVEEVLSLVATDSPDEAQNDLILRLKDRLQLDPLMDSLERLQSELLTIKKTVLANIETAAKLKAELSVKFEYTRLSSHQSLLEAKLTTKGLEQVHLDALFGRVGTITQHSYQDEIEIERFFFQTSTEIKQAYGFNLGFGAWSAMSRNSYSFKTIETRDKLNRVQLATLGMRGYQDDINGDKRHYYLSFDAQMVAFSTSTPPKLNEFTLGLTLLHKQQEASVTSNELDHLVDDLSVWGMTPEFDSEDTKHRLSEILKDADNVRIVKSLHLDHDAFVQLLPLLGQFESRRLAISLAAALPINHKILPERATIENRVKLYDAIFEALLNSQLNSHNEVALATYQYLKAKGCRKLARKERDWRRLGASKFQTLAGIVELHPRILHDIKNLCDGFAQLNLAYHQEGDYSVLEKAFNLFDDMGEHGFYNRFFAHYVLQCTRTFPQAQNGTKVTVKLEFVKDGKEIDVLWGKR